MVFGHKKNTLKIVMFLPKNKTNKSKKLLSFYRAKNTVFLFEFDQKSSHSGSFIQRTLYGENASGNALWQDIGCKLVEEGCGRRS